MNKLVDIPTNPNVMRFNVKLQNGKVLRVQTQRALPKKGEQHYGNGTHVIVYVNEQEHKCLDTRYETECNTPMGYQDYMCSWVQKEWKTAKIDRLM